MNNIKPGDICAIVQPGILGDATRCGGHILHPHFQESKIPTHVFPTFKIDENWINKQDYKNPGIIIEKFQNLDPDYPDSRQWIKEHLYGRPAIGDTGIIEMMANGLCGGALYATEYYYIDNIFILEPVIPWCDLAQKAMSVFGAWYFKKQLPYDYAIYLQHAAKIGTGWVLNKLFGLPVECSPWLGEYSDIEGIKDRSIGEQDCIELAERMANHGAFAQKAIYPDTVIPFTGNVNSAHTIDILLNPFFRVKKDSPLQLPKNLK